MKIYANVGDTKPTFGKGHFSYDLLGEENGCVNGCTAGLSVYVTTEYLEPGVHKDQEGFFVIEGKGYAKVGGQEIRIVPGVAFLADAGEPHSIKTDKEDQPVKVFWFHSGL